MRNLGIGVHESFGEGFDNTGTTGAISADKSDILATAVGEDMNNFFDNAGVFGLLDFVGGTGVTSGKIGSEMLESGGVAEGKIASDTAVMDRFFAVFDDTV